MIDFGLVAESLDYQGCDTLMFTSKQAVESAQMIDPSWNQLPTIAIGSATATKIKSLGGKVLYHPKSFYGKELAADIAEYFRSRKVLYLRPKSVSFDSRGYLLQAGYDLKEQVIYETFCRSYTEENRPVEGAIVIFTSPSTIHCFMDTFGWDDSYTAVVIGKATVEHLPKGSDYHIAAKPLIDECIRTALAI